MKRILIILSAVLMALSCNKMADVRTVDLATLSADYEAKNGDLLSGIINGNYKITIADGATITLKNAVIYGVNEDEYSWAGITALGDATLVLEASNIVRGFASGFPGIFIPEDKTLTIKGNGKLDAGSKSHLHLAFGQPFESTLPSGKEAQDCAQSLYRRPHENVMATF